MYEHLIFDSKDGIATITLNRPDVYNAINNKISYELQDVFKKVAKDAAVRVVVLRAEGKAFCSGQDLKEISGEKRSLADSLHKRYNPIIRQITALPKPVICALNGTAAGAGCSIALACDLIVAAEEASLIEIFINVGLVPDSGSSFFLPKIVGNKRAFEYCTQGTKITAQKALELGLVNHVVAKENLENTVSELAQKYAVAPTKAIGLIKKMLAKSQNSSLDEMLEYEAYCQEIAGNSNDYAEGVQSFIEKRKPNFKGN